MTWLSEIKRKKAEAAAHAGECAREGEQARQRERQEHQKYQWSFHSLSPMVSRLLRDVGDLELGRKWFGLVTNYHVAALPPEDRTGSLGSWELRMSAHVKGGFIDVVLWSERFSVSTHIQEYREGDGKTECGGDSSIDYGGWEWKEVSRSSDDLTEESLKSAIRSLLLLRMDSAKKKAEEARASSA